MEAVLSWNEKSMTIACSKSKVEAITVERSDKLAGTHRTALREALMHVKAGFSCSLMLGNHNLAKRC